MLSTLDWASTINENSPLHFFFSCWFVIWKFLKSFFHLDPVSAALKFRFLLFAIGIAQAAKGNLLNFFALYDGCGGKNNGKGRSF